MGSTPSLVSGASLIEEIRQRRQTQRSRELILQPIEKTRSNENSRQSSNENTLPDQITEMVLSLTAKYVRMGNALDRVIAEFNEFKAATEKEHKQLKARIVQLEEISFMTDFVDVNSPQLEEKSDCTVGDF